MEATEIKKIPLTKKSTSYKIIIPAKVERLIRFLCERVWDTEWSGVLFYNPVGRFEDGSLEIHCVDILPMDIGNATYTEFTMSPDVISYMAQNPELLDCKMGLIHSHNNMSTFFSGTDTETLREEGAERNHFVSLIVNNAGKYTAAITRKIKYTSVRDCSYESFDGVVSLEEKEVVEGEEIEYFNLDIVFEEEARNEFQEVAERLSEIKKAKSNVAASTNSAYVNKDWKGYPATTTNFYKEYEKTKQPTLFDDLDDWDWYSKKPTDVPTTKEAKSLVPEELIEKIVNQLITGSVTLTKLDAENKKKIIASMDARFGNRFGRTDEGLKLFEYWATDFIEFLLWYSVNDVDIDESEVALEIAEKTYKALEKLPHSKYIECYLDILTSYVGKF